MRVRPLAFAVATLAAMASIAFGVAAPAQAATADRWGFAYVNNPTVPPATVLDPAHQAGTWPPGFHPPRGVSGAPLPGGRPRRKGLRAGAPAKPYGPLLGGRGWVRGGDRRGGGCAGPAGGGSARRYTVHRAVDDQQRGDPTQH